MASAAFAPRPDDLGRAKFREYKLLHFLGKGGFAEVSKFVHEPTGQEVAIKSVMRTAHRAGVNLGAIKELQAMTELRHENVLSLLDCFPYADRMHLVLEYCVGDLTSLIRDRTVALDAAAVKGFMLQILRGAAACHAAGFLHRDVKPDNLLLTSGGVVKLADFGHATRMADEDSTAFHRVVTLWYRPPELLMGAKYTSPAIDSWSCGCVLAELLLRQPLFPAMPNSRDLEEREQCSQIFRLMGTPVDPEADAAGAAVATSAAAASPAPPAPLVDAAALSASVSGGAGKPAAAAAEAASKYAGFTFPSTTAHCPVWPGCTSLPAFAEFEYRAPQPWRSIFPQAVASDLALDLVSRLLAFDPAKRLSVSDALRHAWFHTDPLPTAPGHLPIPAVRVTADDRNHLGPAPGIHLDGRK